MLENIKYIGGTVVSTKDTWNWVASVDFTSLYPSILMTLNIGADTLVVDPPEELLQLKICIVFHDIGKVVKFKKYNADMKRDHHIFSAIITETAMEYMHFDRKSLKALFIYNYM